MYLLYNANFNQSELTKVISNRLYAVVPIINVSGKFSGYCRSQYCLTLKLKIFLQMLFASLHLIKSFFGKFLESASSFLHLIFELNVRTV